MANGLPSLPFDVSVGIVGVILTGDGVSLPGSNNPQWGLYLDGVPVVVADNVLTFGFKKSARISRYPQQNGAFASYNKVTNPGEPRLRYSAGGSLGNRTAFLASIAPLINDTLLYDVISPEASYFSYNIVDYGYDRNAENASLIDVEIRVEEVVIAGASTFGQNTANPDDSSQGNKGLQQPQPYTGPNLGPLQGGTG